MPLLVNLDFRYNPVLGFIKTDGRYPDTNAEWFLQIQPQVVGTMIGLAVTPILGSLIDYILYKLNICFDTGNTGLETQTTHII